MSVLLIEVKVSDLTGAALDWAVAKYEGREPRRLGARLYYVADAGGDYREAIGASYSPSTAWSQGGPIIEREGILLRPLRKPGHASDGQWLAMFDGTNTGTMVHWVKRTDWPCHYWQGDTPLIAAMRCYVASKKGETVMVPKELMP
jgi:hypothetical protein